MIYFILGILFWQLVTFIFTAITEDTDRGAELGSLVWWFSSSVILTFIVKVLKVDFKEVNYKRLRRKWRKAIKKENYDFGEFRSQNGKFWNSSFNKLVTSEEFKNFQKRLDK